MLFLDLPIELQILVVERLGHEADVAKLRSTCRAMLQLVTPTMQEQAFVRRSHKQMLRQPTTGTKPLKVFAPLKVALRRGWKIALTALLTSVPVTDRARSLAVLSSCCLDPLFRMRPEITADMIPHLISLGAKFDENRVILYAIERNLPTLFILSLNRASSPDRRDWIEYTLLLHDRFDFLEYAHDSGLHRCLDRPCKFHMGFGERVYNGLLRRSMEGGDGAEYLKSRCL
jgi:hypothetical protein